MSVVLAMFFCLLLFSSLMRVAGGGKTGLKSAEAILKYQTVSSTIFALPSDDGFTDGHNITNPDFLFADNTFLIVADTGNDRLVLFNMTSTLSYVYYDEFKMAQSLKPVPEFRRPVALAMFLPGLEYRCRRLLIDVVGDV